MSTRFDLPYEKFIATTGEACEHFRYFICTDGEFYALDMVRRRAYRRQEGKPLYLLCDYCVSALVFGGTGILGPLGRTTP